MRTLTFAIVATVSLVLTGCSQQTPGNGSATPSASNSPTSNGPVVPQVTNPLDTTKFEQNPCGVLSPEQAQQVANLTTSKLDAGAPGGPICAWRDENHNSIGFSLNRTGGLTTLYRNHRPDDGYFEPVASVSGYPAVFASLVDGRSTGSCVLSVGVSNDVAMVVDAILGGTSPDQKNPCPLAQKAAEAAIATLKAGA